MWSFLPKDEQINNVNNIGIRAGEPKWKKLSKRIKMQ